MPELPEVETVVRTLRPAIVGRRILNAEFRQARVLIGSAQATARALIGRRIKAIERYGKFIAIRLDRGWLVVHLGMTGKLLVDAERTKWTHAIFTLDTGVLHYDDQRQLDASNTARTCPSAWQRWGLNRWRFRSKNSRAG